MSDEGLRGLARRLLATDDPVERERFLQALRRARAPIVVTAWAVYRCDEEHEGAPLVAWLRFYDDGLVLSVTTTPASLADVLRWFDRSHRHSSRGRWRLEGDRLSFDAESEHGRVEYEGTVAGEVLDLRLHGHINGHRSERVFSLVPLP